MSTKGLIGAAVGAALGAALWAAISHFTGYEVGYVAWAISGLVGGIAAAMGGRGSQMGVACAGLALVAILVGKFAAGHFMLKGELREFLGQAVTREHYDAYAEDAEAFSVLKSVDDYPRYMVDYGFTGATGAGAVSSREVSRFITNAVPRLQRFHAEQPSYATWSRASSAEMEAMFRQEVSTMDIFKNSFGLMDILFLFLGVTTAFKLGEGTPKRAPTRPRRARRRPTGGLSAQHPGDEEPPPSDEAPPSGPPVRRRRHT